MQIVLQMLTDLILLNQGVYGPINRDYEKRAKGIMSTTILELREI